MARRKPYTARGVRRLQCYRCRQRRATQQWQVCADGNIYRPICTPCDVELNALVLQWVGDADAERKMAAYRARMEAEG